MMLFACFLKHFILSPSLNNVCGEMAEWLKAIASKAIIPAKLVSWVQIPLSPPSLFSELCMKKSSPYKYIVFDIFDVLLTHNASAGFMRYLDEKMGHDNRIDRNWSGNVIVMMQGFLTQYCPLCDYKLCTQNSMQTPARHITTALKEGKLTYEGFKVAMTYMLTHYVKCDAKVRIILDYAAEYLSRPDVIIKNYSLVPAGVALFQYLVATYGPEYIFILSNMPAELFALQKKAFPEIFSLLLEENCFIAGHIGIAKPDPAAFKHLIAKAAVPASTLLLLDDNAENCAVARSLGMGALQFAPVPSRELAAWYAEIGFDPRFPAWGSA